MEELEYKGWRVPVDFEGDGCTMAPDRWITFKGWVSLKKPCRLHDFLRIYDIIKTSKADKILREHLIDVGAPVYVAYTYWIVVRIASNFNDGYTQLPPRWEEYGKKK